LISSFSGGFSIHLLRGRGWSAGKGDKFIMT